MEVPLNGLFIRENPLKMDDDWVPVQENPQMEIWKPGVKMLEVTSGT